MMDKKNNNNNSSDDMSQIEKTYNGDLYFKRLIDKMMPRSDDELSEDCSNLKILYPVFTEAEVLIFLKMLRYRKEKDDPITIDQEEINKELKDNNLYSTPAGCPQPISVGSIIDKVVGKEPPRKFNEGGLNETLQSRKSRLQEALDLKYHIYKKAYLRLKYVPMYKALDWIEEINLDMDFIRRLGSEIGEDITRIRETNANILFDNKREKHFSDLKKEMHNM